MCGVAVKIYNVGRPGIFVRAQPKLGFGRPRHVFIYSARKTLVHLGKKHDSPILIEKNASRKDDRSIFKKEASPDVADRTFPNRHHPNII